MIKGIGVDAVSISEMRRILSECSAFEQKTFTEKEREEARTASDYAEYLATRFAAKEAVFKAVAHATSDKTFDLRIIETLNYEDGAPYVNATDGFASVLEDAGIGRVFVSITTECDLAICYALATSNL